MAIRKVLQSGEPLLHMPLLKPCAYAKNLKNVIEKRVPIPDEHSQTIT